MRIMLKVRLGSPEGKDVARMRVTMTVVAKEIRMRNNEIMTSKDEIINYCN